MDDTPHTDRLTLAPPPLDALDAIKAAVGPKGWTDEPERMAPHLKEWRGRFTDLQAALVVFPASTEQVAEVVKICAAHRIALVPQGGNTSLCGASTPGRSGHEIIVNLSRMNRIRAVDADNYTLTAEAGCILQTLQETARDVGRLFPLSLGAEGSCQIGGNLSTNAGGVNVLRYGNARELVLGLEVVLPDGRIWNGLRGLRKDNTGYDLKDLFVGAEGTLGIITAAVLKLYPLPVDEQTCFLALADLDHAVPLFARARAASGDCVTSFEVIGRFSLDISLKHVHGLTNPLAEPHDWYILANFSGTAAHTGDGRSPMAAAMEQWLEAAFDDGLVADGAIAQNAAQAQAFWRIREAIPEAEVKEGASIKHDVSVPVSRVTEFLRVAGDAVTTALPGLRPCPFGHLGDGNIHFNLTQPADMDAEVFLANWEEMNRIVHDIVAAMGGSISAEHGVGRLKREEIRHYKDAVEIELMKTLKSTLDPLGIMNPGKVV
ncbi:MAG: FAD-binding oxidoreductase [Alphaproteobacteria bacterium]|nr:FAD-binding oxidoreductase [Alphaproteobacteria bacterium]